MSTTYETFDVCTTAFPASVKRSRWRIWSLGAALAGRIRFGHRMAPKAAHFHPNARLLNDMDKDVPIGISEPELLDRLLANEFRRIR